MPARPNRYPRESTIMKWLRESGYTLCDCSEILGIGYSVVKKYLQRPAYHITLAQMRLISSMVERPLIEVFYSIMQEKNATITRSLYESWKDMTGLNIDTVNEPESETE